MASRVIAVLLAALTTAVVTLPAVYGTCQENEEEETLIGRPSTIRPASTPPDTIELPAGTRLHNAPQRNAAVLEILDAALELPVLDRQPGWIQVQLGAWRGWIEADTGGGSRPVGAAPVAPSAERIARAQALLAEDRGVNRLGPFVLYSDVVDADLLGWLSDVATDVIEVFVDRFDLDPGDSFSEAVVLFANEEPYRTYQQQEPGWAEMHTQGYSRQGLAVLFVGDQAPDYVASILVHEITHLLLRRVFVDDPPAWLDEGLAEDLAYCQIDANGHLKPGTLGGERLHDVDGKWTLSGGRAHLTLLLGLWTSPERPRLWQLTDIDRTEFLRAPNRTLLHTESAFLIRSLIDGLDAKLRTRFLEFLQQVSTTDLTESLSVWTNLAVDPEAYEIRLHLFLRNQAAANALPSDPGQDP